MTPPIHDLNLFGEPPRLKGALAQKFTVPPFSVLDARSGPWQDRKRAWLRLGIQSELGRTATSFNSGSPGDLSAGLKKTDYVKGLTYQMTTDPYAQDACDPTAAGNGTSIFDPALCELLVNWFCPAGGQVIDPFAGGSVRGVVTGLLGRKYWGVDLSRPQIEADRVQGQALLPPGCPVEWHVGDASAWVPSCPDADFVLMCPPYFDLEVYSDDRRDLSAMNWHDFRDAYAEIIGYCTDALRDDRFAAVVVGDVRTPWDEGGAYRNLPGVTVEAFRAAGAELYNQMILVTAVGSLAVRADRQFTMSRKCGTTHQSVLVFVKGDGRAATDAIEGKPYAQRQADYKAAQETRRGLIAPPDTEPGE